MLKRISSVVLTAVLFAFALAGCGNAAAQAAPTSGAPDPAQGAAQVVTGKIKEINGNEILLAIGRTGGRGGNWSEGERPSFPDGERPSFPDGERPQRGERPAGSGQRASGDAATGGAQAFTLTGEEATYLIPVTAEITAVHGETTTELRFTQLAVKNVVRLYLDESGEIYAVRLLQ